MTLNAGGDLRTSALLMCVECGREIDLCAFCDETGCGVQLCYRCVNRMLYQAIPETHRRSG